MKKLLLTRRRTYEKSILKIDLYLSGKWIELLFARSRLLLNVLRASHWYRPIFQYEICPYLRLHFSTIWTDFCLFVSMSHSAIHINEIISQPEIGVFFFFASQYSRYGATNNNRPLCISAMTYGFLLCENIPRNLLHLCTMQRQGEWGKFRREQNKWVESSCKMIWDVELCLLSCGAIWRRENQYI